MNKSAMLLTISTVIGGAEDSRSTVISEPIILAVLTLFGVIVTAYLTYLGVKAKTDREQQSIDRERIKALEDRLEATNRRNMGLWTYCRLLIDHIYRGLGAPPPDPPEHIRNLFD